ncbi:MAG TPA: Asp-tRNA(Asn)/Glu-tRNA(Gln) amidotransferase subunit GatB, partial [Usitatibacter sp.]|nr:Asp-tRNA(Asn)/Glu-tRNA(Gln) amidotransferase subunit GatB [Usitatibacter sp.]
VGATVARRSVFARKNYFYPDLPKGYQISQYELPIVHGGQVEVVLDDGSTKTVRVTRAHLEEDAGKSLHEDPRFKHSGAGFHGMSGIDLNRAGTPLLEIVSEPDLRSSEEAVAYARALHTLVRWIGICDGNMQEGSFRCDANVSVRRPGEPLGTRCEIKNLNSFRFLEKAIVYEARRQMELIEDGGKVRQETRLFDPERGETRAMRSKEEAEDYRYFPDPDLLPLEIAPPWIDAVRASMPELPEALRRRYRETLGLGEYEAALLTESREKAAFFERVLAAAPGLAPRLAANWTNGEMSALLNDRDADFSSVPVTAEAFARLLARVADGMLSAKAAKTVLQAMAAEGGEPDAIIERLGLRQISDAGAIEAAVDRVLAASAKLVEDYRSGKEKAFNALVGQVMKATQGKANPAQAGEILRRKLGAS